MEINRPTSRAQLLDAGVDENRLRTKEFIRRRRGSYVQADAPTNEVLEWLSILPPGTALYGSTAAAWYGVSVQAPDDQFQVIVPAGHAAPRVRDGLRPHQGLHESEAVEIDGVLVTTPERTWLDLSQNRSRTELVVIGDALVRKGLTTPGDLEAAADDAKGRRGIVNVRKYARLVRDRVDSPQETRLRLRLYDDGLTELEVNPDIFDDLGGWVGRPDLADMVLKVAIQYEGDVHRTNKKRWRADIARDNAFRVNGWEVVRIAADDMRVRQRPATIVRSAQARQRARLQ